MTSNFGAVAIILPFPVSQIPEERSEMEPNGESDQSRPMVERLRFNFNNLERRVSAAAPRWRSSGENGSKNLTWNKEGMNLYLRLGAVGQYDVLMNSFVISTSLKNSLCKINMQLGIRTTTKALCSLLLFVGNHQQCTPTMPESGHEFGAKARESKASVIKLTGQALKGFVECQHHVV